MSLAALFVALRALGPEGLPATDLCLFHRFTGYACPACGLTRAAAAATRGELGAALGYHPLFPLVALELLALVALAARHVAGRPWPRGARALLSAGAVATGALFAVVWVARAALGTLPP